MDSLNPLSTASNGIVQPLQVLVGEGHLNTVGAFHAVCVGDAGDGTAQRRGQIAAVDLDR